MRKLLLGTAMALSLGATSAHASLIADGVTYTLNETTVNSTTVDFTLTISGINGSADTEMGRSGVQSFALTDPFGNTPPTSVTAPSGFTYIVGGLNSNGCDGSGGFYCFAANTTPPTSPLAADSSLSYSFEISTAPNAFPANYAPDFKINWVGSKNNYDLVSQTLTPSGGGGNPGGGTPTPEPLSLAVLGSGLVALGFVRRRWS